MHSAKYHFLLGGLAVLLVTVGLRLYAVANSDVIQRDGVTFIGIARVYSERGTRAAVDASHQHVGYPILVAGVHRALFSAREDPESWERAGQCVSLAAGVLATMGVWALAGLSLDWQVAWVSGLLFAVGRKWVSLGADVMSDASALCGFIWAINCGLMAMRGKTWRGALGWGAAAGALAGAGYWVRPEAGGAAIVACAALLAAMITRKVDAKRGGIALLACAAAAALVAVPYMVLIGGLTSKVHGGAVVEVPRGSLLAVATTGPASDRNAVAALLSQTVEAMNPVSFGLFAFGLLSGAVHYSLPVARRRPHLVVPKNPEGWAIVMAVALYVPVLLRLHARADYLDWRHCMALAMVLAPLAGSGMASYLRWFALDVLGRPALLPVLWAVLFPAAMAGAAFQSFAPIHGGRTYIRDAATYLRHHVAPADTICVNATLIKHYAQLPGTYVDTTRLDLAGLPQVLAGRSPRPSWLALSERWLAEANAPVPGNQFELVATFPRKKIPGEEPDSIRVYRIHWDADQRKPLGGPP